VFSHSKSEIAIPGLILNGAQRLCAAGAALIREFQVATEIRAAARDCLLLSSTTRDECEDDLSLAKKNYFNTLVAWVTHRGFCVECRVTSVDRDLIEFASF
jgi:hypothetical protein